jgi:hypothetical protein
MSDQSLEFFYAAAVFHFVHHISSGTEILSGSTGFLKQRTLSETGHKKVE